MAGSLENTGKLRELIDKFQFGELKKRNLPIKTYKLLTIKLLYSMFLINYYIGAFVWK